MFAGILTLHEDRELLKNFSVPAHTASVAAVAPHAITKCSARI